MISRILVPEGARMSLQAGAGAVSSRPELLVPRHLIPANARMPKMIAADSNVRAMRDLPVSRLLVPAPGLSETFYFATTRA